jgi:hypothetical protein
MGPALIRIPLHASPTPAVADLMNFLRDDRISPSSIPYLSSFPPPVWKVSLSPN